MEDLSNYTFVFLNFIEIKHYPITSFLKIVTTNNTCNAVFDQIKLY